MKRVNLCVFALKKVNAEEGNAYYAAYVIYKDKNEVIQTVISKSVKGVIE